MRAPASAPGLQPRHCHKVSLTVCSFILHTASSTHCHHPPLGCSFEALQNWGWHLNIAVKCQVLGGILRFFKFFSLLEGWGKNKKVLISFRSASIHLFVLNRAVFHLTAWLLHRGIFLPITFYFSFIMCLQSWHAQENPMLSKSFKQFRKEHNPSCSIILCVLCKQHYTNC